MVWILGVVKLAGMIYIAAHESLALAIISGLLWFLSIVVLPNQLTET